MLASQKFYDWEKEEFDSEIGELEVEDLTSESDILLGNVGQTLTYDDEGELFSGKILGFQKEGQPGRTVVVELEDGYMMIDLIINGSGIVDIS